MKNKLLYPVISILIFGMFVAACIPDIFNVREPSEGSVAATAAVQTLQALETQAWVGTLQAELTRVSSEQQNTQTASSATQMAETAPSTPEPTETRIPATATPIPPTATFIVPTSTPIPCYWAQFIKDITVPDGTEMDAGKTFTKTWRLKNIGTCTWDTDFDLVFISGNAMSSPATVDFTDNVQPGETVDVSVSLTAPTEEGEYKGNWMLRSDNGVVFGLGASQDKPFWVSIEVPSDYVTIDPDKPLNFAKSYLAANWSTSEGEPSNSDDFVNGSVYTTNKPKMEKNRVDDELALIMIPGSGDEGYIVGKYPAVNIEKGDRLTAVIGCTSEMPKCNVTFEINYRIGDGSTKNLGTWAEVYDGEWTTLNIDLSPFADESVRFSLRVLNNGSSKNDRVFWLLPRIQRN